MRENGHPVRDRRQLLKTLGASVLVTGLAGCSGDGDESAEGDQSLVGNGDESDEDSDEDERENSDSSEDTSDDRER